MTCNSRGVSLTHLFFCYIKCAAFSVAFILKRGLIIADSHPLWTSISQSRLLFSFIKVSCVYNFSQPHTYTPPSPSLSVHAFWVEWFHGATIACIVDSHTAVLHGISFTRARSRIVLPGKLSVSKLQRGFSTEDVPRKSSDLNAHIHKTSSLSANDDDNNSRKAWRLPHCLKRDTTLKTKNKTHTLKQPSLKSLAEASCTCSGFDFHFLLDDSCYSCMHKV